MRQMSPREKRAFFHSPLGFLREGRKQVAEAFLSGLAGGARVSRLQSGRQINLFVRRLEWDSGYFGYPVYRLDFADWDEDGALSSEGLASAVTELRQELSDRHGRFYLFCEIPSEDLVMLQAMGLAGMRCIETRLTYFYDGVERFSWPSRFPVRQAGEADIPALRSVAIQARNAFDRYHADPFFSQSVADEYMATFVENSVRGFADAVMVPAEGEGAPGAFFTAVLKPAGEFPVDVKWGRIVLVAVGEERRGWHLRLMSEMSYFFRERGVEVAYMATQSTNRAVIRNCEKLGYRYGRASHVFASHA